MTDKDAYPRFVAFGEGLTDFVPEGRDGWRSVAGGSCWNVARVAATLGIRSAWGGSVSRDRFGNDILEKSEAAGIDRRFIQTTDAAPLIALVRRIDPPDYVFVGESDLAFDPAALPAGWERHCEIAQFGCISLVRQPLGSRLASLAHRLHDLGVTIVFDPNYRNIMPSDYPALFEDLAGIARVIKLSDEDLARIYPEYSADDAMARVRKIAPDAIILYTRGAHGLTLLAGNERIDQPAFPVTIGDSVGCGDGCVGAFVASRLTRPDASWQEHARFTAATAAVILEHVGAHAPRREEVEALLAAHDAA